MILQITCFQWMEYKTNHCYLGSNQHLAKLD